MSTSSGPGGRTGKLNYFQVAVLREEQSLHKGHVFLFLRTNNTLPRNTFYAPRIV